MTAALATEVKRLNKSLGFMHQEAPSVVAEVPVRIHSYGTDDGHGLGGPPLSEELIRYIGQICHCGRKRDESDPDDYGCSATPLTRFHVSDRKSHPQRMKRALRRLRDIAPAEWDAVYLIVHRGYSWHAARDRINDTRRVRSQPEYDDTEFMVLTIAGAAKLVEMF